MNQLAVLTAFAAALFCAANSLPTSSDLSYQLSDDDGEAPSELYSINQPSTQGVFDGDGYSYNQKHFIQPSNGEQMSRPS